MTAVDSRVRDLTAAHLRTADRIAPGLVDRLYLTGSVALGDYRPGSSDVDFVAMTSEPADDAALAAVHAALPAMPHYDGMYLDRTSFSMMVDDEPVVPHVVGGEFHTDRPCGELNPVLWVVLTRYGLTMRGPDAQKLGLRVDTERLRAWNVANLTAYWQPHAGRIRALVADRTADAPAHAGSIEWTVLGPARLHYTLATGDVTSKSGAGRYAAEEFPAWADLAGRAVDSRDGRAAAFTTVDYLAAAALTEAVVADAVSRWG